MGSYLTCIGGCETISHCCLHILMYDSILDITSPFKSMKIPLNTIFLVCGSLKINLTPKPHFSWLSRKRKVLRWAGPDLLVFQSWKLNALRGFLWIHLSPWLFPFLFWLLQSLMGNKVCEELHLCAKEKKIKALSKVYFQSEAAKLVVVLSLCRFLAFQQIWWTLLVQTTAWFQLLAWWMSWSVHLNDRKAAYHVPHRQATDICHLQSFSFPLASPSFCLLNRHSYTSAHIHTLFCKHRVSTSKASLPLISLITQTVCCSTPPSSAAWGNGRNETGEKGKGRQRGRFIHSGGLICSERCCFGSKNFPLTCVQLILWNGCPLSRSDGTIPPRLQIGRWEWRC